MNTCKTFIVVGSAILSTLTLTSAASGANWTNEALTNEINPQHEQLYAVTSDTTALTFICKAKKFRAAISTTNNDAAEILNTYSETRRRIDREVELTIDGKKVSSSKWKINPARNIFVTPDRSTTAKIYNAAINGKIITIQRKGESPYNLTLPNPDKTFVNFGANCGIGKKKESS